MLEPKFTPWWARNLQTDEVFLPTTTPSSGQVGVVPIRTEARNTKRADRLGLILSGGLHLLLAIGLLVHPVSSSFGAPGNDLGTGVPVALVSGFASGGAAVGPVESQAAEASEDQAEARAEETPPLDAGSDLVELPKATDDQPATRPPTRAAMALAHLGTAANAFEGAVGSSEAQGGDPSATSDLLGQIARCLPPDFRPRLAFSSLIVLLGPDGRLGAAPTVRSSAPQLSAADRAMADRVVQAALQCGPYEHPDAINRAVAVPIDFTSASAEVG